MDMGGDALKLLPQCTMSMSALGNRLWKDDCI